MTNKITRKMTKQEMKVGAWGLGSKVCKVWAVFNNLKLAGVYISAMGFFKLETVTSDIQLVDWSNPVQIYKRCHMKNALIRPPMDREARESGFKSRWGFMRHKINEVLNRQTHYARRLTFIPSSTGINWGIGLSSWDATEYGYRNTACGIKLTKVEHLRITGNRPTCPDCLASLNREWEESKQTAIKRNVYQTFIRKTQLPGVWNTYMRGVHYNPNDNPFKDSIYNQGGFRMPRINPLKGFRYCLAPENATGAI